ncbi:MAG: ECF transporter S component [Clostridia bacterium]|nr:ECF transporter S component [Clostridia bacterium]
MENKETSRQTDIRKLTGIALFTAIVVVLQLLGSVIRFGPFSISLVLIPIVIGAALYGKLAGTWLGLVFGVAVLLSGDASPFMAVNPLGTVLTVLAKGALAGFLTGWVYSLLTKKNETLAVIVAAVVCPVVNTGVFLLGCLIFFLPTVTAWGQGWAEQLGIQFNLGKYMILGLVGGNFLFELLFNVILGPVIVRLIHLGKKK